MAMALLALGVGLYAKTPSQVAKLEQSLSTESAVALDAELARMDGVQRNWPRLQVTWAVVSAVAFALYFGAPREWGRPVAMVLLAFVGAVMLVDTFGEIRGEKYVRALRAARDG
jgi:hypothetical protein